MGEAVYFLWNDVQDRKSEENQADESYGEHPRKAEINPENWFADPLDFRFLFVRGLVVHFVPFLELLHPQCQHEDDDALEKAQAPYQLLSKFPEDGDRRDFAFVHIIEVAYILRASVREHMINAVALPAAQDHIKLVDEANCTE